jgi:hypothetical protein
MSKLPLHRRDPVPEIFDHGNEYVGQIRRMRDEFLALQKAAGNLEGPISHALNRIHGFATPASEWTMEHICRFQAVFVEQQPDMALFPEPYVLSNKDKTFVAAEEDGFFLPTRDNVVFHAGRKMHNNFFVDLMQLQSLSEPTRLPSASSQSQKPYHDDISGQIRAAISKKIQNVAGPTSLTSSKRTSLSLMHNFLKYVASMEHLLYPDFPFWCPT